MATRKRSRSSGATPSAMRRTTSLSELAPPPRAARGGSAAPAPAETGAGAGLSAVQRWHSSDCFPVTETAAFLKACGLCNRHLGPGRDTFIYMCVSLVRSFFGVIRVGSVCKYSYSIPLLKIRRAALIASRCFPL
uniref:FLZ-type domain-containing protein n=1 Tax=Arundo donax TaxID=35708 RepID=A0A0A9DNY9_ARUDO